MAKKQKPAGEAKKPGRSTKEKRAASTKSKTPKSKPKGVDD